VRAITPVETYYRLGDELFRIDRSDVAETYFARAKQLAPLSPLPYEGAGMLASDRDQHGEAVTEFKEALQRGSTNFLAHYIYAKEKFRMTANGDRYRRIQGEDAGLIRSELKKSIALMPDFAPAHQLLGFFEMVQGDDMDVAEQQLQQAILLEPENSSYLLSLAQLQIMERNPDKARATLAPLLLPSVDPRLRASAQEVIEEMLKAKRSKRQTR